MTFLIRLNRLATLDIRELFRFVEERSGKVTANRWVDGLLARIDTLDTNPEVWPLSEIGDLADAGIRELLYRRNRYVYRIFYRVAGNEVFVHRIRSAFQDSITSDDL
jgi:plasmid stabilization system protein ParE